MSDEPMTFEQLTKRVKDIENEQREMWTLIYKMMSEIRLGTECDIELLAELKILNGTVDQPKKPGPRLCRQKLTTTPPKVQ
jgi:hypothetical protein